ncbi:hypothetical protein AGMMS49975_14810 [Clostridia bacterium]|nr:hypothetical protein AGMMS49975_14810 [Clostridia bacterium]
MLHNKIKSGEIIIIDKVYNEISAGDDDLSDWMKTQKGKQISTMDAVVISEYSNLVNYVQTCKSYNDKARKEWAGNYIADPWIVAFAKVHNLVVVTLETPDKLRKGEISGKVKIPNMCDYLGIECCDLLTMMREFDFSFK